MHTDLLLQHPTLQFGMTKEGSWVEDEVVGSAFLERLELSQELLECRSSDKEASIKYSGSPATISCDVSHSPATISCKISYGNHTQV